MIKHRQQFSFSEYFYAIDLSSAKIHRNPDVNFPQGVIRGEMDAIWFKRKNGHNAICSGKLVSVAFISQGDDIQNLADMMKFNDPRYGGRTEYKWDGHEMYGIDNAWKGILEAQNRLDPLLQQFPNVPIGYEGWFSVK